MTKQAEFIDPLDPESPSVYTVDRCVMEGMLPLDLYDADGTRVDLRITAFDIYWGDIEHITLQGTRRITKRKPPLTWKKIIQNDMIGRKYHDG